MIYAGTRPPDRAERARARAERAQQPPPGTPSDGPPEVGQQRAWNQTMEGAIDIVISGHLSGASPAEEVPAPREPGANL